MCTVQTSRLKRWSAGVCEELPAGAPLQPRARHPPAGEERHEHLHPRLQVSLGGCWTSVKSKHLSPGHLFQLFRRLQSPCPASIANWLVNEPVCWICAFYMTNTTWFEMDTKRILLNHNNRALFIVGPGTWCRLAKLYRDKLSFGLWSTSAI